MLSVRNEYSEINTFQINTIPLEVSESVGKESWHVLKGCKQQSHFHIIKRSGRYFPLEMLLLGLFSLQTLNGLPGGSIGQRELARW